MNTDTKIYYEQDADRALLNDKTIAIVGYGAQGRAHALNLRDSGCRVVIGQREGGQGFIDAQQDGFDPISIESAASQADIVNILLPDEVHGDVYKQQIASGLQPGNLVMTCHGFSFHYDFVTPDLEIFSALTHIFVKSQCCVDYTLQKFVQSCLALCTYC